MVWVQGGGHPADVAPSPQSPVLGAFDVRNLARPGTLSYGSPALGGGPSAGGPAPPKDTLRILAPGRPKSTGKTVVPSFMVSTLSICVPRMLSRALVGYSQYALLYKKLTQFVRQPTARVPPPFERAVCNTARRSTNSRQSRAAPWASACALCLVRREGPEVQPDSRAAAQCRSLARATCMHVSHKRAS